MVVVLKSSGAVCICVDMKSLNENVLREIHPMPQVDISLAQLTGTTMFSYLYNLMLIVGFGRFL